MRSSPLLLALALLVGADVQDGAPPVGDARGASYRLVAETEIKQGSIRQYAESTYAYSVAEGGRARELWTLTRHDHYLRHWISPSGRVWVMTSGMPGPGGAATLWTRDPSGNGYGPWGFHTFLPPTIRGTTRYAQQSASGIDLDRVTTWTGGRGDASEGLRMPLKAGGEARVTLVAQEGAAPILLARTLKEGERDLVAEGLAASPYQNLSFARPVARSPLALWQYREEKTGRTRRILQTLQQATYGAPIDGVLVRVTAERTVDLAPAAVVRTPAARVLWFGLSRPGEPEAARLTVMRYDGAVLKDVDLLKLGGYRSLADLKARLAFGDVRVQGDGGWVPIDPDDNRSPDAPELLEIRGEGVRVLVRIDEAGVEVERFTGLAAKRPKESPPDPSRILSERAFASPDGRFHLRERHLRSGTPNGIYALTLLGQAEEPDGRVVPVELWSGIDSDAARSVRVTDSGRTFVFRVDPPDEDRPARPVLFVREADGRQIAGMDLFQAPARYRTADDAVTGLRLDAMTWEASGAIETRVVDDVRVRVPRREAYRLTLSPGRVLEFEIGPPPFGGEGNALSWRAEPSPPPAPTPGIERE